MAKSCMACRFTQYWSIMISEHKYFAMAPLPPPPIKYCINFKIANHFPHPPFFSTCSSTFSFACLSFHSFSEVVKYQFALHPICLHFVWCKQFQHCSSHNLEFSPSSHPNAYQPCSTIISKSTISSRPLNHLALSSCTSDLASADTVRIYKLYLLTYLLIR